MRNQDGELLFQLLNYKEFIDEKINIRNGIMLVDTYRKVAISGEIIGGLIDGIMN